MVISQRQLSKAEISAFSPTKSLGIGLCCMALQPMLEFESYKSVTPLVLHGIAAHVGV